MFPCCVKYHHSALLVSFVTNKELLIQADYDQLAFAQNCGFMPPNSTVKDLADYDLEEIEQCPECYEEIAE